MSTLGGVTNANVREGLGDRCFTSGAIAIDANPQDLQTTVAIVHCINGVFQTDVATAAAIDISGLTVISAKDGSTLSAAYIHPAKAAGDDNETIALVLAVKGDEFFVVEQFIDVAAAQDDADYTLNCPNGYAACAVVTLVRTAADVVPFQFGGASTLGSLVGTGRTAAYFNVSVLPGTIAELVTV